MPTRLGLCWLGQCAWSQCAWSQCAWRGCVSRGLIALLFVLQGALAPAAHAQGSATLNVFSASETPEDDFHLSRPTDLGHLRFGAQLHFDYAHDPLVFETELGDRDSEAIRVVEHQLNATLGLSFGVLDRLVIYAGLPVVLLMDGDEGRGILEADGAGLGDAYLGARVRLYGEDDDTVGLGLQLTGTFPTAGSDQRFRGDEFLSLHPEVLLELRPGAGPRIVLNVGARIRENVGQSVNLGFSDELTYGLGLAVPLWHDEEKPERHHLDLHVQAYGSTPFDEAFQRETSPLEATLGLKHHHDSGFVAGAAVGLGLTRGFGSPDVRAIAMLGWAQPEPVPVVPSDRDGDGLLDEQDRCPDAPEDADAFEDEDGCPDADNDGDGIQDDADECPLEPETMNEWEDEDGCPDEVPDTDGDGLADNVDQCVDTPEDADGYDDDDGCPDPDNDEDGVLDGADGCPIQAGPIENRGCPDQDRDGDTVVDRMDNCPDEPGTPENRGCAEEQQVVIQEGRLEILDKVYFRTGRDRIQRRSFSLLLNVAEVVNNHPEIGRIQVEGHTDSRGRRAMNLELSQRRAQAVVDFLVAEGEVDADRLVARGFGPDRPIVENARSRADLAQNRRVEFNILPSEDAAPAEGAAEEVDQ